MNKIMALYIRPILTLKKKRKKKKILIIYQRPVDICSRVQICTNTDTLTHIHAVLANEYIPS